MGEWDQQHREVTCLLLNPFLDSSSLVTRVWAWSSVLRVCQGVGWASNSWISAPLPPHPGRVSQPPQRFHSFQASLVSTAWIYTDVNQVISTSWLGEEVWPKGNCRAEVKGGWG